jgi:hypothetical protein
MDKGAGAAKSAGGGAGYSRRSILATGFLDTVHLRTIEGEPAEERVVRPSLAILFRVAVGPAADYYAPRFLEYERRGYSFPSWNWAAPWAPTIWAFYHKLWGAGLGFALWPVAAMAAFGLIDPYLGDSTLASVACAILLLWVLPGIVAGLIANTLIYHSTREVVRRAEAETLRPDEAAKLLGERSPIALGSAVVLGIVAIPSRYSSRPEPQAAVAIVRCERVAARSPRTAAAPDRGGWDFARSSLVKATASSFGWTRAREFLGAANVRPRTAACTLLGPLIPELGAVVLLAPTLDRDERVHCPSVPALFTYLPRRLNPARLANAFPTGRSRADLPRGSVRVRAGPASAPLL